MTVCCTKGRKAFATPRSENAKLRLYSTTVLTPALWLLAILVFIFVATVHSTVIVGYTRDEVLRELGVPDSSAKVGTMESLMYKNGTCITLQNGKVEDIKVRGQIRLGKIVKETSASPVQLPAARPLPNVQPVKTIVTRLPEVNESSQADISTNVVAQSATTEGDEIRSASAEKVPPRKVVYQPLAKLQPTQFDNIMNQVRRIIAAMAFVLVLCVVATHVFLSYCFKLICEKTGKAPETLVWIPVVQFIPLLRAASMPAWLIALFVVPLVNVVLFFVLWARICIALKKSPWLVATLLIPVVNLAFISFLAFSRRTAEETAPTQSWPAAKPPTAAPMSHPLSDDSANFPVGASGVSG